MDRRRFLTGASAGIGAAALGAFVKPAPTPFSEIPKVAYEPAFVIRTGLPQGTWRMLNQGVPMRKGLDYLSWAERELV